MSKRAELRTDGYHARVHCGEPALVARFVSEARQEVDKRWPGSKVLLRGQTCDHEGMVPALFRVSNVSEAKLRDAEADMEKEVRTELPNNKRFVRPDLAALLQHYGVKTRWLDVVDDLRTAAWFATHEIVDGRAQRRADGTGWIYLMASRSDAGCLTTVDLRLRHHGLSLRPHVQQGWSITGKERDLDDYVAAAIEFPVDDRWHLDGDLAAPKFLFPPASDDDTLHRLNKPAVTAALRRVEKRHGLAVGALGNISTIHG